MYTDTYSRQNPRSLTLHKYLSATGSPRQSRVKQVRVCVLVSLIRGFVIEFVEQDKWFGLTSTVPVCFLCVLPMYIYILRFTSRPSSMKASIVLCCNINKLTCLLTIYELAERRSENNTAACD